ncbi:MAG TPA: pyridoxamine 5'-phosphate oxidase family protein [Novimethylophilus sp.]|jgi:hypothetical protein|uniref:pyridoxamine 5'-phosphate oxidase family protein n=1 Tax=Novimethylophilus sp. TaxID=2137426 RepID=UPI002F4139F2
MTNSGPYHDGERQVQALAGKSGQGEAMGRAIAKSITPGAWQFLAAQSMLVLGSWDGARGAWPSLLFGEPGFAVTHDGTEVQLAVPSAWADHHDPLWHNLRQNGLISLLAIELSTRRRLRINGHLRSVADELLAEGRLDVIVDQAYPNCPKYIQRRILRMDRTQPGRPCMQENHSLNADHASLIANADACFVASVHQESGTDVSHRGGLPGFVRVESTTRLRIPDYVGNGMFNTLGNIHESGFAGLLFIDFDNGRQLQVIGDAKIDWSRESATVERSWLLDIQRVRESSLPHGLKWEFVDFSPFNPTPMLLA